MEVMVAMVILGFAVMGLNLMMVNIVSHNAASKEISNATSAGNQLLDNFRQQNYDQLLSGSDVVGERYLRSWTVTSQGKMKTINLKVSWPLSTRRRSIELTTIISDPEA